MNEYIPALSRPVHSACPAVEVSDPPEKRESNQVVVEVSIKGLYVNYTVLAYGKM